MVEQIIGVDCATQVRRVGLAVARRASSSCRLVHAVTCFDARSPAELIEGWINEVDGATLLALDAPLGWPASLGGALSSHRAGLPLIDTPNALFRRHTDRVIAKTFGKTPLDVGADRIARTAYWALLLLAELRRALRRDIPLVWDLAFDQQVVAIEVYPAATLLAHGASIRGYKAPRAHQQRSAIVDRIGTCFDCRTIGSHTGWSIDVLDAVVCVLAGLDFVHGCAEPPDDLATAQKEGWIWVRAPRAPRSRSV
jgi:hypothetical protein